MKWCWSDKNSNIYWALTLCQAPFQCFPCVNWINPHHSVMWLDAVTLPILQMRKLRAARTVSCPSSCQTGSGAHALSCFIATALETQVLIIEIRGTSLLRSEIDSPFIISFQEMKEEKSSYNCPLCEKICTTQHQLTMHIRQVCCCFYIFVFNHSLLREGKMVWSWWWIVAVFNLYWLF